MTITDDDANSAPVLDNAIPDQSAVAGTGFSYQVPADAFSDPDNDTLSYAATKPDGMTLPTWLVFTAGTRTFAGTPAATDVETVSVKVTATDTSSATVSDEFDIVVAADTTPPTLTSATVTANGRGIALRFFEAVARTQAARPQASAFTVTADGIAVTVDDINTISGQVDALVVTVSPVFIRQGQTVVVTYTDPTTGDDAKAIQDTIAGNDAASFTTGMSGVPAVTNDSTLAPVAPGAPTGLTATASGTDTINLSWTAPVDNGGRVITGYKIEISSDSGSTWTDQVANTASSTTTYEHTGLAASTTRHYRVSAINSIGTGTTSSDVASATTGTAANTAPTASNGTVTTNEDTDHTFAAADFNFSDADTGDTLASVIITVVPTAGSLTVDGNALVSAELPFTVSKAVIDAAKLKYTPPANANGTGYASFSFKVNDGTVDSTSAYTMTINVTAVNATLANTIPDRRRRQAEFSYEVPANTFNDTDTGDLRGDEGRRRTCPRGWSSPPAVTDVETVSVKVTATDTSSATVGRIRHVFSATITANGAGIILRFSEAVARTGRPAPGLRLHDHCRRHCRDGRRHQYGLRSGRRARGHGYCLHPPEPNLHRPHHRRRRQGRPGRRRQRRRDLHDRHEQRPRRHQQLGAHRPGRPDASRQRDRHDQPLFDNGGHVITGYKIEISSDSGSTWTDQVANTASSTTTYEHTGLAASTTRHYRVSAISIGTGTNVASATTGTAANTAPTASNGTVTRTTPSPRPTSTSPTPTRRHARDDHHRRADGRLPHRGRECARFRGTAVYGEQGRHRRGEAEVHPTGQCQRDGYASFSFKVNDGTVDSTSAYTMTINVTAVNDPRRWRTRSRTRRRRQTRSSATKSRRTRSTMWTPATP